MISLATIPFAEPFLDRLAEWGLRQGSALADAHFLLPTRRAARALADAILARNDGAPLLLPRITALGAPDETPLSLAGTLDLPPAIATEQRLAVLTRLILAMGGKHEAPTTADRAWPLAAELARLLDEAARAEIDLADNLPRAVGGDWAGHWQVTLDFLGIVTRAWPDYLAEAGLMDIAARQIALLHAQADAWDAAPPAHAVIAAGATGAIPAVARVLRVISRLPAGQVVLPGLDLDLDEESWQALADTHPQAGMRALLAALDATRGDVRRWPGTDEAPRETLLRRALLPAASLAQWRDTPTPAPAQVFELAAGDQQEEAVAIALALRDAIETPHARAALVTPDRALAARVAAELRRFGVVADDSAGEPLADTPPAVFLRLLATALADAFAPVALLSLLKHPLATAGLDRADCLAAARALERAALRGQRPPGGLAGLRRRGDGVFLDRLEACLAPLRVLADDPPPHLALAALIEAAEALAATPDGDALWRGEEGAALSATLAALLDALAGLPPQPLATLPTLLEAALAGIAVRTRRALRGGAEAEHPRVFIWGLLEARLQTADLLVLGGLTEGTWPASADAGPWMCRAMRAAVGLPSPELLIGQMAHDFASLACAGATVVLSHPRRRDGKPAVPARWLVRLRALLAGAGHALPAHSACAWAGALDRGGPPRPVPPPAPCPPVALRPRRLSVTEIETWLRDPYAIYARHVLRLRRLDPLEPSADAADYGSIVHAALADFWAQVAHRWPPDAEARLVGCMHRALDAAAMRPALAAWWRPRLARIARWVFEAEAQRRIATPTLVLAEQSGEWIFDAPAGPFTLRGRVDRIERSAENVLSILDYKTGTPPSAREVDAYAKQLPLEAVMLRDGAFGDIDGEVGTLEYWKLSGGYEPGAIKKLFAGNGEMAAAIDAAEVGLRRLVADFDKPERAYLSQPNPGAAPRFAEFARLARVAEWSVTGDAADDEECE